MVTLIIETNRSSHSDTKKLDHCTNVTLHLLTVCAPLNSAFGIKKDLPFCEQQQSDQCDQEYPSQEKVQITVHPIKACTRLTKVN